MLAAGAGDPAHRAAEQYMLHTDVRTACIRCGWTYLALTVLNHSGFSVKMYVPEPDKSKRIRIAPRHDGPRAQTRTTSARPRRRGARLRRGPSAILPPAFSFVRRVPMRRTDISNE